MSIGKTKKDTRLQNLNTWSDEFRPLNQGPSPSRSPLLWVLSAGCPFEKYILQMTQREESSRPPLPWVPLAGCPLKKWILQIPQKKRILLSG
ncbi:hypothetical protein AXF42_Ash012186 [Apostasia shenzhenica]|uniref:Uncharacterized protein n=1 Tax=Apostasia shenzhenica TaxID=1088818 RepID=A0A2I0B488_9ASPA|nr:hypothetical protein AXF42_Ash012186 [Apostasia shenzhenica]